MRILIVALVVVFALLVFPHEAEAQAYCAHYNDGERTCAIPTLEMCQQSIRGIGGYCSPDQSAQIPPNFMQRRMQQMESSGQPFLHPPDPLQSQPGGLNWMPPPPSQ